MNKLYMYKNNQQIKEIKSPMTQGNLHEDNLKDLDRRIEPMVQATMPTPPAERYVPDPTTDPEVEQRQAATPNEYPSWVFYEYFLSNKTLWGKAWPDGKEHLVPKSSFVNAVIDTHIEGEKTLGKMIELAFADSNKANTLLLLDAWTTIFVGVDKTYVFEHMQALGRMTQSALARRAFDKYTYLSAASRLNPNEDEPEWFMNRRSRMIEAATKAGTYCRIHSEMWQLLEWKNSPNYNNVANEIKLLIVNQAKWIEDNYGPKVVERPKVSDQHALAAMC